MRQVKMLECVYWRASVGTDAAGGGCGGGGCPEPGLGRARRGLRGPQGSRPFLAVWVALALDFPPLRAAAAAASSSSLAREPELPGRSFSSVSYLFRAGFLYQKGKASFRIPSPSRRVPEVQNVAVQICLFCPSTMSVRSISWTAARNDSLSDSWRRICAIKRWVIS